MFVSHDLSDVFDYNYDKGCKEEYQSILLIKYVNTVKDQMDYFH